jgi:hypothetical protein
MKGRRPDSSRRRKDNVDVLQLGLLPRDPFGGARLQGRRAGLARGCACRHMDVEARRGPRAPASRELGKSPAMKVDRIEREEKRNRD